MQDKVNLIVDNVHTKIEGSLERNIFDKLRKEIGYRPENADFMVQHTNPNWDGWITTLRSKNKEYFFPTGVTGKVRDFLKNHKVDVTIKDLRQVPKPEDGYELSETLTPRPYQEKVVKKCIKKQRGYFQGATGCGKTLIGSMLIAELGISPFIFYVPSIDLLEQAASEIEKFVLFHKVPLQVGRIGGGYCEIEDINVMTVQTAVRALGEKYKAYDDEDKVQKDDEKVKSRYKDIADLIRAAKGYIGDECHIWRSDTCQSISTASKSAYYRIGLSATPRADSGDDILIDACFGRLIEKISASHLIKLGYLVKPKIKFVPVNNMRGSPDIHYQTIYKNAIAQNAYRNDLIAKLTTNLHDAGKNILVLVKQIEHGKILNSLIDNSTFINGTSSKKSRREQLASVRDGKSRITIGSTIADQGVDCKPWDTLILAGSGKSPVRALQRVGRVLRLFPGKTEATVIDFWDNCKYMLSHAKKRKAIYETEPEFKISFMK